MKKYSFFAVASILVWMTFNGCKSEPSLKVLVPVLPDNYNYNLGFFGSGDNTPADNRMTNAGAALGRALFYDPRLSINNTISCASCHKQELGFADNSAFSKGFEGKQTLRNTPAISNSSTKSSFFWDGRAATLEEQTLMPVRNHIEMGLEQADVLVKKLQKIDYYPGLFMKAFGTTNITSQEVSKALSQFVRSMVSSNTRFDAGSFTTDERKGMELFMTKFNCGSCHRGTNLGGAPISNPYYSAPAAKGLPNISNIGLDVKSPDAGVEGITNNENLNGYFVIPSLRNVELTAPYMHDGRFKTLDEVIEHYSNGILPSPNLDPVLVALSGAADPNPAVPTTIQPVKMNITTEEKAQLIAFLKTLTDRQFTSNPIYSNPFK